MLIIFVMSSCRRIWLAYHAVEMLVAENFLEYSFSISYPSEEGDHPLNIVHLFNKGNMLYWPDKDKFFNDWRELLEEFRLQPSKFMKIQKKQEVCLKPRSYQSKEKECCPLDDRMNVDCVAEYELSELITL
jgi:hypothetical protein